MAKVCIVGEACTGEIAHYFTIEARVNGLMTTSQYDNGLPGEGIVIHEFRLNRPAVGIGNPCFANSQSGWAWPVDATPGDYDSVACTEGGRVFPNYALNNAQWLPGQTYTNAIYGFGIKVVSRTGSTFNVSIVGAPDVTPPTIPTSFTATVAGSSQINLNWSASTDSGGSGLVGYSIERCVGVGCFVFSPLSTTPSPNYPNTGLSANTSYSYRVRAYDSAGNYSVFSNIVSATTPNGVLDNFDGTVLQSTYWTSKGLGAISVIGGAAGFACRAYADTSGKYTISGNPIVIESRMRGAGNLRDTTIALADTMTGDLILVGDTSYLNRGLYSAATGAFNLPMTGNNNSVSVYKEYRLTLTGNSLTVERGDTLANITESTTRTMAQSIVGKTFFVRIGTGGPDYCPATFDWIRLPPGITTSVRDILTPILMLILE